MPSATSVRNDDPGRTGMMPRADGRGHQFVLMNLVRFFDPTDHIGGSGGVPSAAYHSAAVKITAATRARHTDILPSWRRAIPVEPVKDAGVPTIAPAMDYEPRAPKPGKFPAAPEFPSRPGSQCGGREPGLAATTLTPDLCPAPSVRGRGSCALRSACPSYPSAMREARWKWPACRRHSIAEESRL